MNKQKTKLSVSLKTQTQIKKNVNPDAQEIKKNTIKI